MKKYILLTSSLALIAILAMTHSGNAQTREEPTSSDETSREVNSQEEESASGYLKIGDIKGESTDNDEDSDIDEINNKPSEGVEPEEIDFMGENENEGIEPDEIDFMSDNEPLLSNFAILLGGSGGDNDGEGREENTEGKEQVEKILLEGAQEADTVPMEQISLNYEKISVKTKKSAKLLGFIPVSLNTTVEIDDQDMVKVKFPWWAFLTKGKDGEKLGREVFDSLTSIISNKHDTLKSIINNLR